MKTTLLILLSTCCGLLAQAPPSTSDGSDPALRDAILRAIVRGEPVTNASAVPGATAPVMVPGALPATAPGTILAQQAAVPPPAPSPGPAPFAAQTAFATQPAAPPEPPEEATNDVEFPGIDVNTFLDVYADLVGRTVLRAASLQAPPITLKTEKPLTHTELVEAMKTVLEMNGVTVINLGTNFVQAMMAPEALLAAPEFSTKDGKDLPDSGQYIVQIVPLKYVKPSAMVQILQPFSKTQNLLPLDDNQMLIIRDYSYNVKRMLELVAQVDTEVSSEFEQEVIPIKYAQAEDIANALSSLGGSTTTGIPRSGGGSRGGAPAGGPGGPGGSTPVGALGSTGGATPISTTSTSPNQSFQQRLRAAVSGITGGGSTDFKLFTGVTKILPDDRANSLMVFANDTDMKTIKKIVRELDVFLPQVLIDSIIMEVSLDDETDLGVSYLQQNPTTSGKFTGIGALNNGTFLNGTSFTSVGTNAAGALPGGLSYVANFGNDFDATVTAVATDSHINVLSRPSVQTSQNVPAEFKVGDTIPYINNTFNGGLNGGTQSSYQQTFVGIDLNVTPLINSDGLVSLDITQDIQQLGPTTEINGTAVPSTTERYAKATVSVKDRDTVILSGFISNTKSKSNSGVPILKDLPLIGAAFRSSSDSLQRVELIVLIRPKVLPTPESAALVAKEVRDRMPLVKQAEHDYRIDENKRLKAADQIVVPDERGN